MHTVITATGNVELNAHFTRLKPVKIIGSHVIETSVSGAMQCRIYKRS